jgi:hypothetical protein
VFGDAWLMVRQAREALRTGRLDEAARLLAVPTVRGHRTAAEVLVGLARAFADRGQKYLDRHDPENAWGDLGRAEGVAVADPAIDALRDALGRLALAEVRALLEAGQPGGAAAAVRRLQERGARLPELRPLEESARDWGLAAELADRGEFAAAVQTAERVRARLPVPPVGFNRFLSELAERQGRFAAHFDRLHEALEGRRWRDVVRACDEMLAAAPQCEEARAARSRAWTALEPETLPAAPAEPPPPTAGVPRRFLLWVDGVGGYLVCTGPRLTVGRIDGSADVPVSAAVSRHHADLEREDGGWLLDAVRPVAVNGGLVTRHALRPGDTLTLGESCRLRFEQPVPVSGTALLKPTGPHRLGLGADAAVLMADTLVLGPGPEAHVEVPDLPAPVLLVRQRDGLAVRWSGPFTLDGRPRVDRAVLPAAGGALRGDGLSLAVEPTGRAE